MTFNYTETLEKVYGIPESNILHIHGSRIKKDHKYIIGHNNRRDPNEAYNDEKQLPFLQPAQSNIINWMNDLVKDTKAIIGENPQFFSKLSDTERVVVYGHSLSEIDWPYMKEIVRNIGTNKTWSISYHSEEDSKQIDLFVKEMGLKNVKKSKV